MAGAFHVAVVGSGPSGFYAAEALVRSDLNVKVDIFDRLPTPFGLVRSGVAPDHPKLKSVITVFERVLDDPHINFVGNVRVDCDLSVSDLQANYHAVIFACGAERERALNIPGEELNGCHPATEFVGWYNGHPDYSTSNFDLSGEVVAIIGHGNVSADVCRILTKDPEDLRHTDISEPALQELKRSRVKEIHIIGRRGPAQAKFAPKELYEIGDLPNAKIVVSPKDMECGAATKAELSDRKNIAAKKNFDWFQSYVEPNHSTTSKTISFHFHASPVRVNGVERVESLTVGRNTLEGKAFSQTAVATGSLETISCDLIFKTIGYRASPIEGLAFDVNSGTVPNDQGRVTFATGTQQGLYVTGWQKRGPTGIIGTNRADSIETVNSLLDDREKLFDKERQGLPALKHLLEQRQVRIVDEEGWRAIDNVERTRGKARGKPREKITSVKEMHQLISSEEKLQKPKVV